MKRRICVLTMGLFLATPLSLLHGQGKEVAILLRNGHKVDGELLSVRDSSVLLAVQSIPGDDNLFTSVAGVAEIPNRQMVAVTVEGKSRVLLGVGLGLVGGTLAGAVIGGAAGASREPSLESGLNTAAGTLVGAMVGGLAGLAIGLVVGAGMSQSDQSIAPNSFGEAHRALQRLARYPDNEPESLRSIP